MYKENKILIGQFKEQGIDITRRVHYLAIVGDYFYEKVEANFIQDGKESFSTK